MRRWSPNRATRMSALLLIVAVALLLAGGSVSQQPDGAAAGHSQQSGSHIAVSVESLDSEESAPVDSERLNVLALGLFLVSLGLLLGSGLVGRGSRQRLLELLRLPSVIPVVPARAPLSAMEVFRL